jgi:hypothetical protein
MPDVTATPDLSLLSNQFRVFGAPIFGRHVLDWDIASDGIQIRTNVDAPQALIKLSALGEPQPYSTGDNTDGNGAQFSEQDLTAYQSKKDYDFDPEKVRNTILAIADGSPFYEQCLTQISREYLNSILLNTLGNGVRNAAGTGAADICDGWLTIIAAMITAGTLTPINTGVITSSNAVSKIDLIKTSIPVWMQKYGFFVYCSYSNFYNYAENYRTINGFKFEPRITGDYPIDNSLGILRPVAWLGTSGRLITTIKNNLVFGTDINRVQVAATPYRNILKVRQLFPAGCAIQDPEAMYVNDQA